MTEKWLLIERTPRTFMFLLWLFGLNMGINVVWNSSGPLLMIHCFRQRSEEEYKEAAK